MFFFLVLVLLVGPKTPEGPGIVTVAQPAKKEHERGHLPSSAASTRASLAPNLDLGPCSLVVVFAFYEGGKGSLPHLLLCRSLGRGHLERSTPPHPLSTTYIPLWTLGIPSLDILDGSVRCWLTLFQS